MGRARCRAMWHGAFYLDITAGGCFAHKTPIDGIDILDRIAKNTSFIAESIPFQEECKSSHEDILVAKSDRSPPISLYSTIEPSPEAQVSEEEDVQPLELPFQFEDDLFEDFENISNYLCKRKQPVLIATTKSYRCCLL